MVQQPKALSQKEISSYLKSLSQWKKKNGELFRDFEFSTYLSGLRFVGQLGRSAEKMDHHPRIVLDYKRVRVFYSTQSSHGITLLDFKAAALADRLYK